LEGIFLLRLAAAPRIRSDQLAFAEPYQINQSSCGWQVFSEVFAIDRMNNEQGDYRSCRFDEAEGVPVQSAFV
jgi:hypothetical protein